MTDEKLREGFEMEMREADLLQHPGVDNVPVVRVEWDEGIPCRNGQSCFRSWNLYRAGVANGEEAERERIKKIVRQVSDGSACAHYEACTDILAAIKKGEG